MKLISNVLLALFISVFFAESSLAGQSTDAFAACLTDSLTGKERKLIMKWMFFSMAAHPELKDFSKVTDDNRNDTDMLLGNLVTRLITVNCPEKAKMAMKEGGSVAIKSAFEIVGKVGMQELMTDQKVSSSLDNHKKYLDNDKINAVLSIK